MPSTPTASSVWTKLIKLVLNSKETSKRLGVRGLFEDYYDEGEDGRFFCGGEIERAQREYSNREQCEERGRVYREPSGVSYCLQVR